MRKKKVNTRKPIFAIGIPDSIPFEHLRELIVDLRRLLDKDYYVLGYTHTSTEIEMYCTTQITNAKRYAELKELTTKQLEDILKQSITIKQK